MTIRMSKLVKMFELEQAAEDKYSIETRDGPKAKWKTSLRRPMEREAAIKLAEELDEHGGSGPVRVVKYGTKEVVWDSKEEFKKLPRA